MASKKKPKRANEQVGGRDLHDWPSPATGFPDFRAAFKDGGGATANDGARLSVRRELAGSLATKGRVVIDDPLRSPEIEALPFDMPSGEHPVYASFVRPEGRRPGGKDERIAAAALVISSEPPVRWERLYTFDVDSGYAGFMDLEAADRLCDKAEERDRLLRALSAKGEVVRDTGTLAKRASKTTDVIAVTSGFGDGGYIVYVGHGSKGAPVAVVAGFGILADDESTSEVPHAEDRDRPVNVETLLELLASFISHDMFDEEQKALDDLSPSVELVLDRAAPVRGRRKVLGVLRSSGLGQVALDKIKSNRDNARASFSWGKSDTRAGNIAIDVERGKILRVTIERAKGAPRATVPSVIGKMLSDAEGVIEAAGYSIGHVATRHDETADNTVLVQSPPSGILWAPPSEINLTVSRGQEEFTTVPNVVGLDERSARGAMSDARLFLQVGDDAREPDGLVLTQDPKAGTRVTVGTDVHVRFPADTKIFLPSLDGLSHKDAEFRIKLVGLKKGKIRQQHSDAPEGTVIASEPAGGADVPAGSRVDLIVCKR
jgi:beta-lactam-binding protein with PASTA domain